MFYVCMYVQMEIYNSNVYKNNTAVPRYNGSLLLYIPHIQSMSLVFLVANVSPAIIPKESL